MYLMRWLQDLRALSLVFYCSRKEAPTNMVAQIIINIIIKNIVNIVNKKETKVGPTV